MSKRIVSGIMLTLLLVGMLTLTFNIPLAESEAPTTDWWIMYQHDLQHTGYSTSKIPNNLTSLWNFSDRADAYCSAPVVFNGTVFINIFGPWIGNGILWALNETNGAPIWSYPMGPMAYNSPAISEGQIFVGGVDGRVYCLNLNGDLVWNFTCEYNQHMHCISPIYSSPVIDSGKVYFLTTGGFFYALNITNGQVVWVYRTPSITLEESSPAIWNGMVYFGSVAGGFRAVNATDGSEIWKFTTGDYIASGPTVIEGKAYIGSADSNFYCLNASNGALIWKFTSGGPISNAPAVFEDKVFFSDRRGYYGESSKLYALKTSDGTLVWNVTIDTRVRTNAIVADGKVFVGAPASDVAHLYAFNLTNGARIWHSTTTARWWLGCSFAISNNKLFVGSDKVYTFGELAQPPTTYSLTVTATVGGTTTPAPGIYIYTADSTVQVTAIPSSGYVFDHWELNGSNVGSADPYSVYMDNNYALKAFFMSAPTPPSVLISPMSASILVGQQITFTSTVSGGTPPYTYQWYLNGNPVSGATSSSWTFTPTASGIYYVYLKVTDDIGNATQSETARITVAAVPVGGCSIPTKGYLTTKPLVPYLVLLLILTSSFTMVRRKMRRRTKRQ